MTISARVILDSISPQGIRLTTLQVCFHRYVLAEFNTHRMFSRNFRSSRAVPAKKLIEEVRNNPAMPVAWLKNRPGMQGGEAMTLNDQQTCREFWLWAAEKSADVAEDLAEAGLHKEHANRVLEPYLYVHGVVTATEWSNFFALRRHNDAQPEMKVLADAMWEAMEASTPQLLQPGEWHLPYVLPEEIEEGRGLKDPYGNLRRVSTARCARVSYLTHEGQKPDRDADLALAKRLIGSAPMHASPAEHQATPDKWTDKLKWWRPELHGNLTGWVQFRKTLPGECVR